MRLVLPLIIISFLLDGLLSNFISLSSHIFNPLCTLVSLVLVYPFFKKNNNSYLITCSVVGLLYDIIYTDTLIVNMLAFLIIGLFLKYFYSKINVNIISFLIGLLLSIIIYRLLIYFVLVLSGYLNFDLYYLAKGIYSSLFLND